MSLFYNQYSKCFTINPANHKRPYPAQVFIKAFHPDTKPFASDLLVA